MSNSVDILRGQDCQAPAPLSTVAFGHIRSYPMAVPDPEVAALSPDAPTSTEPTETEGVVSVATATPRPRTQKKAARTSTEGPARVEAAPEKPQARLGRRDFTNLEIGVITLLAGFLGTAQVLLYEKVEKTSDQQRQDSQALLKQVQETNAKVEAAIHSLDKAQSLLEVKFEQRIASVEKQASRGNASEP